MLAERRRLAPQWVAEQSRIIHGHLLDWPSYRAARTIMLYLAMADEPQTDAVIIDALKADKTVCVPVLGQQYGIMEAAVISGLDDLVTGRLGLRMPDPARAKNIDPVLIDLVLVPGVAFDRGGNRLGMGAGYYDRFLTRAPQALLVGMAWSFQVVDAVPAATHDVSMHYLLTEEGIFRCGKGKM